MRAKGVGSLFLCVAFVSGCNQHLEVVVAAGDACESLEPLLAALPDEKRIEGLPPTYRGCNVENAMVSVIYKAPEGSPSYEYSITVIDEKSKYLASFAAPGRPAEAGEMVVVGAAMARARWDQRWSACKEDFMHPTDGTRPMLMRVQNFTICVYALDKGGKRMLQTFALRDGLGYDLIMDTPEAANAKDIVAAWKAADFEFERFNPLALQ
jgi:hypothetical protein